MSDPLGLTGIGVGILTNLLSHPLCKVLESEPVRRFCLVCEDQTRQRSFGRIFTAVRQTLPPEQRRYIDRLADAGFLRHEEGFELHKLFGGGEAPDAGKMAALMRRLDPALPPNLDAILAGFLMQLEDELRRHPDFAPWIAWREIGEMRRMMEEDRARRTAPPPPPTPFTVPPPVADFQGRDEEIAEIEEALAGNGRAVISALSGMGGIGKSQLAYEVVHRLRGRFPDGAIHLDMLGTSASPLTPEDAIARVLQALDPGARPPTERPALEAAYRQALDGKRLLLLLDNAKDTAQVKPLLPPAPVALLVTSRRRIVLPGARPVQLDPMKLPTAIGLLREILGDAAPGQPALERLAEACGRLPLALRAAGTFLLTYGRPVDDYLAALREQRLALLARIGTDDPALDVRAALTLSYDRLVEEDAALAQRFTQLAVFPAGFLPDAAAAVWELARGEAQAVLDTLLARSLLQLEGELRRYRLHDLLRDLARDKANTTALAQAEQRHAAHYAGVLGQTQKLYLDGGEKQLDGLHLFDAERGNIEIGQAWAAHWLAESDDAARLAYDFTNAGSLVLDLRLTPRQRIGWLESALEGCRRANDPHAESNALGNLGLAWADLGETRKATEYYELALAIARTIGNPRAEVSALGNLGLAWADLGEVQKAVGYYEQALATARENDIRHGEGNALGVLGLAWAKLGETGKAIWYYEQALATAREIAERRLEGDALGNLGLAWAALGEARKAIGYYEQQLAITRVIGDRGGEGRALNNLAQALDGLGERERAIACAQASLLIKRAIEDPRASEVEAWLRERGVEV